MIEEYCDGNSVETYPGALLELRAECTELTAMLDRWEAVLLEFSGRRRRRIVHRLTALRREREECLLLIGILNKEVGNGQ